MFGGGIVWFYRILAGMNTDPAKPGYQNIIIKPQPAGDVTSASYSNETSYGKAAVDWEKKSNSFRLNIDVPVGSTATVYVPASGAEYITEGGKKIRKKGEVHFLRMEKGYAIFTVGSGYYSFDSQL
jgi:alpha-L-rhamnosidase